MEATAEEHATGDVRRTTVPPEARELSTLSRIDYEDAHVVEVAGAEERTAEEWARTFLEEAPAPVRAALRSGWASLGIQLGPTSDPRLVLGWEVSRCAPDFALLTAAGARLGLNGEVLVTRRDDAVLVATFLQLGNPAARGIWAGVAPGHREIVRRLLGQCVRRA